MKTLVVYVKDSYYRYPELYVDFLFYADKGGDLIIYSRDTSSGEEKVCARFKTWDYFIIDEE